MACHGNWHTLTIADGLRELGLEVHLITTLSKNQIPGFLRERAISIGYLHHASRVRSFAFRMRSMYRNPLCLAEFGMFDREVATRISLINPDICFLWTSMAVRSLISAKRQGAKTVLVQGNSTLNLFHERVMEAGATWEGVDRDWIKRQEAEYMVADIIQVESKYVAKGICTRGIPLSRIRVVPPHVSVPEFESKPLGDGAVFGTVQMSRRKGSHLLLAWWRDLAPPKCKLLLLGSFRKDETLCPGPFPHGVVIKGFLRGDEYWGALRSVDVAIFPTYDDGGPRALFECMAAGACPIVSERSAGPDHIKDGVNGFVIPIGENSQWKERIAWCANNPGEVRLIGARARQYVKEKLSIERYPFALKELLASI